MVARRRFGLFDFVIMFAALALSAQAVAQANRPMNRPPAEASSGTFNIPPPQFGTTSYSVESVHAFAFQSNLASNVISADAFGYRYISTSTPEPLFIASVNVPSGVVIDYVGLNYCQTGSVGFWDVYMYDNYGDHQASTVALFTAPNAQSGCGYYYNSTALGYQYNQNQGHVLSFQIYQPAVFDGSAEFLGAEVWYRRIGSPAPVAPDFGDVPVGSPQFQFIEALFHSGITAGCGGGNYCPNSPVTRGQMAVFLAKALGLSWPY